MSKKITAEDFPVEYHIYPGHPEAHQFTIECRIKKPDAHGQILSLPAWIPGSYMIRDFAKNVIRLDAYSEETPLGVRKIDKDSWKCDPCPSELKVIYHVYARDLSVRSAHLDTTHGFFNGTSVFLRVHGKEQEKCKVIISAPQGEKYRDWQLATSLEPLDAPLHGFGVYQANDYDELVDHPVEMGHFSLASFEIDNVPHDIVLTGKHRADIPRLCNDLKKICQTHIALFGELPPLKRYVFLVMVVGDGYGGLEHRASTSLLCSRDDLPLAKSSEISESYRGFLGLCSHEYFHTWNIKRIKPEVFLPYDLTRETYTRQLWAFEGITSYYDDLGLLRSGLIDIESYLELLSRLITRVWRGHGRFKQSVAESSFDVWTKFYKQDESAPNNIVSYYTKGSLIALALDLTIRQASANHASLDEVMRYLWQHYGKPLKGVPEGEIEKIATDFATTDLSGFFERYLYGNDDPPLEDLFASVGIQFNLRQATSADDKGGKTSSEKPYDEPCYLGARITQSADGARITHVYDHGPAQQAGLSAEDTVIAVDSLKTGKAHLEKYIASCATGDEILLHVFRRDELMKFKVHLTAAPYDTCYLTEMDNCNTEVLQRRKAWSGIK